MHRLGLLTALLCAGCRVEIGAPERAGVAAEGAVEEVWMYTSIYQEVLDQLGPALEAAVPGVKVSWFQAGSEKVSQRWEAEHAAGRSRACLLATSDPGWYLDLHRRGLLQPYVSPRALEMDRAWVHPDFAAFRLGFMVLAASGDGPAPASFRELADPAWRGQVSSPDPLASGTMFTTLSAWEQAYGFGFVEGLRGNGWVAAGGNSAVMGRMESGERRVGVVLLENLLQKPGVARIILPTDGAVAIPGMLAIPTDCDAPAAARRAVDWLMSDEAQRLIVAGNMYSPFPGVAPPAGAPPLAEVPRFAPEADLLGHMAEHSAALKARYEGLTR